MSQYPNLTSEDEKRYQVNVQPTDNSRLITSKLNSVKTQAKNLIQQALRKQLTAIEKEKKQVPEAYRQLRNQTTNQHLAGQKKMEETLANTGNHTASGYAVSKRMNQQNQYHKNLQELNLAQERDLSSFDEKRQAAVDSAGLKKAELENQYSLLALEKLLEERKRGEDYALSIAKENAAGKKALDEFLEKQRMNDETIRKSDIQLEYQDREDQRKQELHEIEKHYRPETYQAQLDLSYEKYRGEQANTANKLLQNEKLANPPAPKSTTTRSSGSSSSSSSSSASATQTTKVSAKDLAGSIEKLAGVRKYDEKGNAYYEIDATKAYTYLMSWQKKYNLAFQVVNDVAIYLGIQDFL